MIDSSSATIIAGSIIGGFAVFSAAVFTANATKKENEKKFKQDRLANLLKNLTEAQKTLDEKSVRYIAEKIHTADGYKDFKINIQNYLNEYEELSRFLLSSMHDDTKELESHKRKLMVIFSQPCMQQFLSRMNSYPYLRSLHARINYL